MILKTKNNIINKESIEFYSLFLLTIFFVYYSPYNANRIFFLAILFLFWKSRKNYFWFAFVFLIIAKPGLLFLGGGATDIHRIPFYNILPDFSFGFYDMFFIIAFLKALIKGEKTKIILRKPLTILLAYLIFLWIFSFFYGVNFRLITYYLRIFTVFTLFISFPRLVVKKEDYYKFIHLLFPIIFFILFSQFFQLYTGNNLHQFFSGQSSFSIIQLQKSTGLRDFIRPMSGGGMLIFFSFIMALFLIEKKNYSGNKPFLSLILITCFLSGFISATRSWIIMFTVVLFLYFLFVKRDKVKLLMYVTAIFLLVIIAYSITPRLKYSVDNSVRRISTIEDLVQGDVTAAGSLQRIDKRLPKVLDGIMINPITGLGFSETYREYADAHVGTFNVLLQVGIIGLIPFLLLWIKYLKMIFYIRRRLSNNHVLRDSLLVLVIMFIGILILQFTTFAFFAYDLQGRVCYFTIIFILLSEFFVREALTEEMSKKRG